MKKDILEQVNIRDIKLSAMNAIRHEVTEHKEYPVKIQFEHTIQEDTDKKTIMLCKLNVGTEESPFEIEVSINAEFQKLNSISGNDISNCFPDIAYPILTEMSLSVAQVVKAMGYPTFIVSPEEIMQTMS